MNLRGQATLELAIGVLIFIPVLLLGIHFAEVGAITLRVNQAAASAVWDTTGLRAHRFNTATPTFRNSYNIKDGAGRDPAARADALYKNFDGLSSGGGNTITQVFTRGTSLQVTCTPSKVMKTPVAPAGRDFGPIFQSYDFARNGGNRVDGMACSAEGTVNAFNLPTQYMEQGNGGWFNAPMVQRASFTVCAIGRASGGSCSGKLDVALDDWALSGSSTADGNELKNCDNECLVQGTGNQAYLRTVKRVFWGYNPTFQSNPDQTIHDFMVTLFTSSPAVPQLANVPVNETDFRFAFIGEEGDVGDTPTDYSPQPFMFPTHEEDAATVINHHWPTTPDYDEYATAYNNRGECFLGSQCGEPVFAKGTW
jgi:hypothetical protein